MQSTSVISEWWTADILIKLRSIEYWTSHDQDKMVHQLVQSHTLFLVTNGEVLLEIDQNRIEMSSYDAFSCTPGQTMGILEANGNFEGYIFFISLYEEDKNNRLLLNEDIQIFSNVLKLQVPEVTTLLCDALLQLWNIDEDIYKFRCQIDFQELLFSIISTQQKMKEKTYLSLEGVKQYIEEHYMREISINQLAELVKLSPKYFADIFKRKYGKTVMEFVSVLRLQAAKRLMHKGNVKVREIAHQVGYTDEFYFSRKFKKEIGITPTNYMNNMKKRIVAYTPDVLGYLIPLNIIPYAAPLHPKWTSFYYEKYRQEIPVHLSAYRINKDWQTNLSRVAQMHADVIITSDTISMNERQMLEGMANVLYIPSRTMCWREQLLYISKQLGESWQAEQWLKAYDQQVHNARQQLNGLKVHTSTAVIRMVKDNLYVQSNAYLVDFLYNDLQLTPANTQYIEDHQRITLGELKTLRADCLIMLIRQDNETRNNWHNLQNEEGWQQLHAVQEHNIITVSSDPWLENSAHAYLRKLQQVMEHYQ